MIDLATDGVRGAELKRVDVVRATRQVMLSAHRAGWSWGEVHALLTDVRNRRLARQISTGHGGRTIAPKMREAFLERHWAETEEVAQRRPAWNRDDVLDFIEEVRQVLAGSDVAERDRQLVNVAIDLAAQYGTTRPALSVSAVATRLGLDPDLSRDRMRVHRALSRLAAEGTWLSLAKRGNRATGRANLYNLAPPLAATYTGATPPMSQPLPMSHAPMSHNRARAEGDDMLATTTIELTTEEYEAVLRMRAEAEAQSSAIGNVVPLRRTGATR